MLDSALFPNGGRYFVAKFATLTNSGTFTAPAKGKIMFLVNGPAGSGAAVSSSASGPIMATGGSAGEVVVDWLDVEAGATLTAMFGNPGAGVSVTGNSANGNDAGNTVITGPNGYSLTVAGGKKGTFLAASGALTGADSGVGSGGSSNAIRGRGGRSGSIANTPAATSATNRRRTGGGGVNMRFTSSQDTTRGGDITDPTLSQPYATGGGGSGGRGGDLTGTNAGLNYSAGGGYNDAVDNAYAGPTTIGANAAGVRTPTSPAYLIPGLVSFALDYFGGGGEVNAQPGPGGGTAGSADSHSAGVFGALGAGIAHAGKPGFGAGSGACVSSSASTTATTAAGGPSFAVFMFLREAP